MSAFQQGFYYLKHKIITLYLNCMSREGECSENKKKDTVIKTFFICLLGPLSSSIDDAFILPSAKVDA